MLPSFVPHNVMSSSGSGSGDVESSSESLSMSSMTYQPQQRRPHRPRADQESLQLAPPSFSICVTGVMSTEGSCTVSRTLAHDGSIWKGTIRYRIFRPRQLRPPRNQPSPLVVLHGGPGIPCNYLLPLVNVVTDRAIVFFDQLGCGRSSRPEEDQAYSISLAVNDLCVLMKQWNLDRYHLFGHSYGGILAFEYLKQTNDVRCLSVILASAPTSVALVESESKRLLKELMTVLEEQEHGDGDAGNKRRALELFRAKHECQALPIPLSLIDAYAQAGTKWRGIQAISGYVAILDVDDDSVESHPLSRPPAFVIRGQDDFVTEVCVEGWNQLFANCQTMVLAGCSHYGLLENEQLYGDVISSFLVDHDPSKANDDKEVGT